MTSRADVSRLWARTFAETHVITTPGREARLSRLVATAPFAPDLLTIDRQPAGRDVRSGLPATNHHIVVGGRHQHIVAHAKSRRLPNVFVFEDDAEFVDADADALRRVLTWVGDHANDWDVFYLGYLAPLLSTVSREAPDIVRVQRPLYAHALCYSARVFDDLLAIDFTRDHRPPFFRAMEATFFRRARQADYFRDGVGSIDSWLSYSRTRRLAAHPILVIQTSLPPGTEAGWERRTGRPYDVRRTPRTLASLALALHYLRRGMVVAAVAAVLLAAWMSSC